MRGVIDSGHKDATVLEKLFYFRDWLIELREDSTNRQAVRRDGNAKSRADGSRVLGPFTLETRQRILKALETLEKETGWTLLTRSERDVIEDIWRRDLIRNEARSALHATITPPK